MFFYNYIRLGVVSISYIALIFGLASIMLKPFSGRRPFSDKILLYFVAGNFYVMNVIFLLLFLRCTSRVITIITLLAGAIGLRYLFDRSGFTKSLSNSIRTFALLSEGVYGWNYFHRERLYMMCQNLKSRGSLVLHNYLVETTGFIGCLVIHAYYIGYRFVNYSSFGIYDEFVHFNWIQFMLKGEIFYDGVYPFGLHNIIYAIIKVFGFQAYTGTRYFGFIMIMFMLIMLFLLLKKVCRSRYTPLIGAFLYVGADIFINDVWDRIQFILPQEFGMLFLYPMLIYLYDYICSKEQKSLILFGICFIMTLYVHYYVTIIALLLCLCVGVSSLYRIIKGKMLFRILICGILSALIGILPMGIGLMSGHGMQGSLYWAMGVINGKTQNEKSYDQTQSDNAKTPEQNEATQGKSLTDKIVSSLYTIKERTVFLLMRNEIFSVLVISMLLIIVKTFIHILGHSKKKEMLLQFSIMLYAALLIILLCSEKLGLPVIIEDYRICVFLSYIVPVLLSMPLELLYELLEKWRWTRPANLFILAVTGFIILSVYKLGYTRELSRFTLMQTEGSIEAFYRIAKECDDFKWTIVSTVDEYSMIHDCGFHHEWIDFLLKIENYNKNSSLRIPTDNIFFFIEKRPIVYGSIINLNEGMVTFPELTEEDAKGMITSEYMEEPSEYYKHQRNIIMAKAYFWAKQYMRYFPNEMSVFYEDDNFICYQLKQDPYYLNNLAIDYKYNEAY